MQTLRLTNHSTRKVLILAKTRKDGMKNEGSKNVLTECTIALVVMTFPPFLVNFEFSAAANNAATVEPAKARTQ